ncbi:MAG: hypothetical protein LBI28_03805 [Treponema sp.]|jgi:hypothetical protein|nr:hypothetical protein [Treponema sp.]
MKVIKIICIIALIVLIATCIALISEFNFIKDLSYNENDSFFDENRGVVYHLQTVYVVRFLLLINIFFIIVLTVILIPKKRRKI